MRRFLLVLLSCLVLLLFSVSCGGDWIVDDSFKATITFNGNGATSGTMEAMEVGKGIPIGLNANTFEKTDLDFTGWNTEADGSGTCYSDGRVASITKDTTLYAQWGIILTDGMTSWTDGNKYVLTGDVTIPDRISVSGSVTLVLRDGCTLTASKGIAVNEGNALTIDAEGTGTGELIATTPQYEYSGIGSSGVAASGMITINGGHVTAHGGSEGPGIGTTNQHLGTITINGGTVSAQGGQGAPGIGTGTGEYLSNGAITINGGTVNAWGGNSASGIGTGHDKYCAITLVINGGTVTASGDVSSAGIGGGRHVSGIDVTINGGTVIASGGGLYTYGIGMGIGKGYTGASDGSLTLGPGVSIQVSDDNSQWSDYDGSTRTKFMRTI